MNEVAEQPRQKTKSKNMNGHAAFEVRDLAKVYHMGETSVHALRGVTLDVKAGSFTVLLGPSGSGKSTFLNILGGLDHPSSGEVVFEGQNLTHADKDELTNYRRHNVGFIFQFYNLIPSLTALENVELVTDIADDPMDAMEALDRVGLANRADHFPSQLSGGEQQRVAIARAIVKRPKVLLCDEPTGALDRETGVLVLEALDKINRELGTTTLIVTHNAATAALGDTVIKFADGDISELIQNETRIDPKELVW
jgi:putative ABC transport system ATP-binding protein